MKIVLLSLILSFFTFLSGNIVGKVAKIDGIVKVKSQNSIKKSDLLASSDVREGDLITTAKDSSVVLKLVDGSDVIIENQSSILFSKNNSIEQQNGKVFYKITSRDAKNSLKVKTPFAIIGIKGTTFVVNSNEGKEGVALKEGKVGVESIKEEFSLYRKEVIAKYNEYVTSQMREFNKFTGKDMEPEITKAFDLNEGNVISFNNNEVKESAWNKEDDAEFDLFEKMLNPNFKSVVNSSKKITKTIKNTKADDELEDLEKNLKLKENRSTKAMKDSMKFE